MGIELLLDMAVEGHRDRVALSAGASAFTYGELQRLARGAAAVAAAHGARQLATIAVTGPLLPVSLFGAAYAGLPLTPLNYRLAAEQLRELLSTIDRPLVVVDPEFLPVVEGWDALSTGEFLRQASEVAPVEGGWNDDSSAAVILFTSGTTSRPKGVLLSHGNLSSYVLSTVEFGAAGADECQLITVPPYHIAGVSSALTSIYSGRRVCYLPQFSAADWLEVARAHRVTSAMVVPTMLARLTEHLGDASADVPSLRSIAYGGARMPRPVLERALSAFPGVAFTNAYGLTETSSTIAVLGPEDHRSAFQSSDPAVRARLGSAGRAVPGVEIAIRDDAGELQGPATVGEVVVRGPQVSGVYVGSGSVLDADGWFATKDRGWLDLEGYLFIEGRQDDTIIRGGENIAPAEVEDVLITHAGVREAAVIGVPDEEWGERLVAVVVAETNWTPDAEELRDFVRSRLRGSRTPDEVTFVSELPYTATGKLLRRALAEAFKAEASAV